MCAIGERERGKGGQQQLSIIFSGVLAAAGTTNLYNCTCTIGTTTREGESGRRRKEKAMLSSLETGGVRCSFSSSSSRFRLLVSFLLLCVESVLPRVSEGRRLRRRKIKPVGGNAK